MIIDGTSNGRAAIVVKGQRQIIETTYTLAQLVDLRGALQVFESVSSPFNLYSDSHYVVRALRALEVVPSIQPTTATFQMFLKIQMLIRSRAYMFCCGAYSSPHGTSWTLVPGK